MSEQELRDGLKLAVADEPPMTFNLDDLMDTAERLARRRRALIAVGASTAAVAVAAVAVPVVLGISGGGEPLPIPQAAPPSSLVASPAPTTSATTPPKRPPLTEAQLRERGEQMRAHLRNAFPAAVPAATQVTYGVFGGESEGAVSDGQSYLNAFVKFTAGFKTAVDVYVSDNQEYAERWCAGCQERSQQDGSVVVVKTENGPGSNNPAMQITSAVHLRKDGTTVRISTYNYDPTGGGKSEYQADAALNLDQLMRLVTDPALHL